MAIDMTVAEFVSISILVVGLIGLLNKSKLFAIFPFMGAIMGFIIYNYLAADGSLSVNGGTPFSDYPFILVPLFFAFGDIMLCAYKAAPASKVLETLFLGLGLMGIDGYFVPTELSGLATTNDVNLPPAMLGFVQNYGEVLSIGISIILMVYVIYSFWFK
jgi:hypothetical protein